MTASVSDPEKIAPSINALGGAASASAQTPKPAFAQLADRLSDGLCDMAHHSRDAVVDAEKMLEDKVRLASTSAERSIHKAPFKSVLIAAGVGAAAATLVGWLIRSRVR